MSEELRWNLSVQVVKGPTVAVSGVLQVDGYSKSQVIVPAENAGTDGTLDVALDTTNAELLLIQADRYVDPADETALLQYAINPGATPGPTGTLSAPILLIGADPIKLLADPVTLIQFTNPIPLPVTINIIVGGDITP